jgi:hypothetical protein
MANRWTQAATILPPTIEVCGRRLLPFCLRHRVALEAIGSPVLETDKEMTAEHMIAAVRILSTYDIDSVRKPSILREKYWCGRMTFSRRVLTEQMAALLLYLEAQSLWPRFWVKDNTKSAEGALPWPLAVVASLNRNGATLEEAWTMPEAEAIWLHIAHCSASGADISVISDKEWEAMEAYKKQEAAEAAAKTNNRN